jgi:Tfp pilus assembly protein PilV
MNPEMPRVKKSFRPGLRCGPGGRGFTIAEVMMAAAVMALAITTSITTMQRAFLALDGARNVTLGGQIMQSEFEKMRLKDWTTISGYDAGPTTLTIDPAFTTGSTIASRFTLTRTVADAHADMKQVTLTITWRGYDGRTLSRYYTTYYGKNGLYDYFYNSY